MTAARESSGADLAESTTVLDQRMQQRLQQRHAQHLYRHRLTLESAQGPEIRLDGEMVLCFCSNDYLGLANHPRLQQKFTQAAQHYGVGSGASHLVAGHSALHEQLELKLAQVTGRDRAVLFGSGYMANVGVLNTLLQRGDAVFEDRLNHASLLDGGLSSGARFQRFAHNDLADLEGRLQGGDAGLKLVVVDGVFSMDGDCAPVAELAQLCRRQGAALMVDDAHGFGVLGATGGGTLEAAGLKQSDAPILMATLGKAIGVAGAFVAGSDALIETLIQFCRTYIYTTALPPATAAAALAGVELLEEESWRRTHLVDLIQRFREGAAQLGLQLLPSQTAIQPLLVGEPEQALRCSQALRERGILVSAIRPPTVPAGTSRLRITITAAHTEVQIDRLLDALGQLGL